MRMKFQLSRVLVAYGLMSFVIFATGLAYAGTPQCNPKALAKDASINFKGYKLELIDEGSEGFWVTNLQTHQKCRGDDVGTDKLYISQDGTKLIEIGGMASSGWVKLIDPATCKTLDSLESDAGATLKGNTLTVSPDCGQSCDIWNKPLPRHQEHCQCTPGGCF